MRYLAVRMQITDPVHETEGTVLARGKTQTMCRHHAVIAFNVYLREIAAGTPDYTEIENWHDLCNFLEGHGERICIVDAGS